MSDIRMVVFDMAGTTVNEGKIVYKSLTAALSNAGIEINLTTVMSEIAGWNKKKGIAFLAEKYGQVQNEQEIEHIHDDFLTIVEEEYRSNEGVAEMEGASDLFRFLRDREIKVVLDTGYHRRTADILIDRLDWHDKIDMSITSDEVEEGRPYPYMIEKARREFKIKDPIAFGNTSQISSTLGCMNSVT